ncbi:MAG: hypothetical protein JJE22_00610, partial [Bacteroidia bacterium]|nr:hypothetical protein [Bacteroidia bacterium]
MKHNFFFGVTEVGQGFVKEDIINIGKLVEAAKIGKYEKINSEKRDIKSARDNEFLSPAPDSSLHYLYQKNFMRRIIILCVSILITVCLYAQDTTQQIISGRKNANEQLSKPYLILISADAFRYDYAKKYNATNLLAL